MNEKGWIKLHRKILDCWIWQIKPFDKSRAWIDLLLLAMHHDKNVVIDDKPFVVKRGSYFISRGKLADRWGWSVKKVDAYLKTLENEKMVTTTRTRKGTVVTIVNYEEYQIEGTTVDTTEDTSEGTTVDIAEGTQNKNNKELKNVNNIKPPLSPLEGGTEEEEEPKKRSRFTPPSVDEVRGYCEERKNGIDAQAFVDFYESKGWFVGKNKMKDWKAAVRTWERNRTGNKTDNPQSDIKSRLSNFAKGGN